MQHKNPAPDFFRILAVLLLLSSCGDPDRASTSDSTTLVQTARIQAPREKFSTSTTGPRVVVDAAASEPALELRDNQLAIRLPVAMASVLEDSLPGFSPTQRSGYDPYLVSLVDSHANGTAPDAGPSNPETFFRAALSVVIGDFNGDSKRDVAMTGIAAGRGAAFFLLSPSHVDSSARLIHFYRPVEIQFPGPSDTYLTLTRPGKVYGFEETVPLELRTDGVDVSYFEKASELYFLDNGVVRRLTTSD